ncbi:MAG: TerB family tellurite resistance protein [Betaproteobacteria bacterium]|nr:TerB family tellurite resistance protein [Betaproteobacteria bacterium]
MLKALRKLLDPGGTEHRSPLESRQLEVAVACLLHESKRVDPDEEASEHQAACDALVQLFGTTEEDGEALLRQGREKARRLTSYYSPVSLIKRDFGLEQRVLLIEHLWRIAYADGTLDPYEDHYVRKIAHLLYVPNTQTMLARSRARPA